jgi:hypothetical protein
VLTRQLHSIVAGLRLFNELRRKSAGASVCLGVIDHCLFSANKPIHGNAHRRKQRIPLVPSKEHEPFDFLVSCTDLPQLRKFRNAG